jgi:hypothetical protein
MLTAARTLVVLCLFAAGIAVGVVVYGQTQTTLDYGPFPPLPEAAEPRAADDLTDLLVAGNDQVIAERYGDDIVSELALALTIGPDPQNASPIVDVRDVKYLGTVADGRQLLAMYAAIGSLGDGTDVIAGFSLRIADGEIIGVN